MKKVSIFFASALLMLGFASCSLDRTPTDPNTNTEFDQDGVFTKLYATFAVTGQKGPDGDGDVDGIDEGTSAFYRMLWELNEFPTDEGWWIWNDVGLSDIRSMTWDKSNALVAGLYYRLYFDITLCNHFMSQVKDNLSDTKTAQQYYEARMIRAINYYYLLDMFYKVPLVEVVSVDNPMPVSRQELFTWLERECLDLETQLPAAGSRITKYRLDQAAAWVILMRMYLNAEVYTGTPQWTKAAEYASKLINSPYKLHETSVGMYSAYQMLFMGDNDVNGAQDEAIFFISQNALQTQSWGGARFLICAMRDAKFIPSGSTDSWSCFRTSPEFVYQWVDPLTAPTVLADEFHMPTLLGDDRAILCSDCDSTTSTWSLSGKQEADFYTSWAGLKWTGVYSTSPTPNDFVSPVGEPNWPETDIPFFRVAEAYMTYAEAVYRGGAAGSLTAEQAIQKLRDRAHNTTPFTIDLDFLLDEWSREFWFEGRRRTDLVRFGKFAGETADYNWEGRGGKNSGDAAKAMDKRYNVYPIPAADETANPNLRTINAEIGY